MTDTVNDDHLFPSANEDPQVMLERLAAQHEETSRRATLLIEADPRLPYMTAITIAGDEMTLERSIGWVEAGEMTFARALPYVGSYGRIQFIAWAREHGRLTDAEAARALVENWSSSDPRGAGYGVLDLWRVARDANGGAVYDGIPLPANRVLRIFRGQDAEAPLGISWTLDMDIARRFAAGMATRQSNRGGVVVAATVLSAKVLAYITDRNEGEVIIDPDDLIEPDPLNPRQKRVWVVR